MQLRISKNVIMFEPQCLLRHALFAKLKFIKTKCDYFLFAAERVKLATYKSIEIL